jgi:hypothetical protein
MIYFIQICLGEQEKPYPANIFANGISSGAPGSDLTKYSSCDLADITANIEAVMRNERACFQRHCEERSVKRRMMNRK